MMKILITGGAGYIGSHTLRQFLKTSHELYVLDNLSKGSQTSLEDLSRIRNFEFFKQDLSDFKGLKELFKTQKFDAVVHFAASIDIISITQLILQISYKLALKMGFLNSSFHQRLPLMENLRLRW